MTLSVNHSQGFADSVNELFNTYWNDNPVQLCALGEDPANGFFNTTRGGTWTKATLANSRAFSFAIFSACENATPL
jgi:hypothetical protein